MFDANIYDLYRQRYAEYTLKYDQMYKPPSGKPNFLQRLLAVLRKPAARLAVRPQPAQVSTATPA